MLMCDLERERMRQEQDVMNMNFHMKYMRRLLQRPKERAHDLLLLGQLYRIMPGEDIFLANTMPSAVAGADTRLFNSNNVAHEHDISVNKHVRVHSATALSIEMKIASTSIVTREITWANTMLVNADTDEEAEYTARCYVDDWPLIMADLDDYHRRKAQLPLGSN